MTKKLQKIVVRGIEIVTFTRYTIQFIGAWEQLHNPNFNLMEFNKIKDVTQLVVLANLEGINAELVRQKLPQGERLMMLNEIAIIQMQSLLGSTSIKRLKA